MRADAVVFRAPGVVEFASVAVPDPGPQDVVVEVEHSWISTGTEASFLRGERVDGETPYTGGAVWPFPCVPGYQKVGRVSFAGSEVAGCRVGDRVFATIGRTERTHGLRGGHLSPSVCAADQVFVVPPGRPELDYAPTVLAQVGLNCATQTLTTAGDRVVVLGDGQVGQWTGQRLAREGVDVLMVGRRRSRLDRFRRLTGQPAVLADAVALGAYSVQAVVDTVGDISSLLAAAHGLERGGRIVSAGFYGVEDRLPLQALRSMEARVQLVSGWTRERLQRTIDLIATGDLRTAALMTHRFPAARVADAWATIEEDRTALGVVLDWPGRGG